MNMSNVERSISRYTSKVFVLTCTFVLLLAMSTSVNAVSPYSDGWRACEQIDINITNGQTYSNLLVIDVNVTELTYSVVTEIDILDSPCWVDGNLVQYEIQSQSGAVPNGSKWVDIAFNDTFTGNQTYAVYHDKIVTNSPHVKNLLTRTTSDMTASDWSFSSSWQVSGNSVTDEGDDVLFYFVPTDTSGDENIGWKATINTVGLDSFTKSTFNTSWILGYSNISDYTSVFQLSNVDNFATFNNYFQSWNWLNQNGTKNWSSTINDTFQIETYNQIYMRFMLSTGTAGNSAPAYYFLDGMLFCMNCEVSSNIETSQTNVDVLGIVNTTISAVRFSVSDFDFATSSFSTVVNQTFNTSASSTDMLFVTSFNVKAFTGNTTRDVYGRVYVDGNLQIEQKLRTISGADDEGSTGFDPITFTIPIGEHYIQVDFNRTGSDSVEINDIDMSLIQIRTTHDTNLRFKETNISFTHSNTSFENVFEWDVDTFYFGKFSMQADATATGTYYFNNENISSTSPLWQRYLADASDTGSVSMVWYESSVNNYTHSINAKSDGANITVTGKIVEFDEQDADNRTINAFQSSNASTDVVDNYVTYGAGEHLLLSQTIDNFEGDSYFIGAVVTVNATTATTPTISINATGLSEANCFSKKERSLSSSSDIGNIFIYTVCEGLTNTSYTFNVWVNVSTGDTVMILDESLAGFEATSFSISDTYLPPIANSITSPSGIVGGVTNIEWLEFFDVNDDLDHYNITLREANSTFISTINGTATDLIQLFDTSSLADDDYIIRVEAVDDQSLTSYSEQAFSTDNTAPVITVTSPINNTEYVFSTQTLALTTDETATILYNLNGGTNSSVVPAIIIGLQGNNTIDIWATDLYGNEAHVQVIFEIAEYISNDLLALVGLIAIVLSFSLANLVVRKLQ